MRHSDEVFKFSSRLTKTFQKVYIALCEFMHLVILPISRYFSDWLNWCLIHHDVLIDKNNEYVWDARFEKNIAVFIVSLIRGLSPAMGSTRDKYSESPTLAPLARFISYNVSAYPVNYSHSLVVIWFDCILVLLCSIFYSRADSTLAPIQSNTVSVGRNLESALL